MKILVTGGAGYIGTVLVPRLLASGHKVRVLDNLSRGGRGLLPACRHTAFDFHRGSVASVDDLRGALEGIDAIVHLAAVVGYSLAEECAAETWESNVEGTRMLIDARREAQPVVYASTGSVYGQVDGSRCTEATPKKPQTLYARSKSVAEDIVLAAPHTVALRFATAFGVSPNHRSDLLVNKLVHDACHTGRISLFEPEAMRTLLHVEDIAAAIQLCLTRWTSVRGRAVNVGAAALNVTKREISNEIAAQIEVSIETRTDQQDPDRRDYVVDYLVAHQLGIGSSVSLSDGIRQLRTAVSLLA